jgi:N-acetylglucosamine malate deacetylase 1
MNRLLKQLVLKTWRTIAPKRARNSLRLWLMLDLPDRAPQLIEKFSDGPIVVLAPHMDDEIIGPGGTIIHHVQAPAQVTFVFMTNGADVRKNESRRAAEIVGVRDLVFLDGPDGSLTDTPDMTAKLEELLADRNPAVIYAPAMTDHHHDHWGTNRILRKVLDRLPPPMRRDLVIRGYEVWTPAPANRMVDITSVADLKKKAIDVFASQISQVDYSRTTMGLNQYRSMIHLLGRGFAEAFWELTCDEYRNAFDQISLATASAPVAECSPSGPRSTCG